MQAQDKVQPERTDKRPNIILFMVDDMGWQDTSLPFWTQKTRFNELYETPQYGTPCPAGNDVYTSLCLQYQFAYPLQFVNRNKCSPSSGYQLDFKKGGDDRYEKRYTRNYPSGITMVFVRLRVFRTPTTPPLLYNYSKTADTIPSIVVRPILVHLIHRAKVPFIWAFEVNITGHAAGGLASYLGEQNYGHTKDGKATSLMSIPGLEKYWGTSTFATEALTIEAIQSTRSCQTIATALLPVYVALCRPHPYR